MEVWVGGGLLQRLGHCVQQCLGPFEGGTMYTLLHSVVRTLQQATSDPHLRWRLLDTHGQVWVSLLWGHCSFLLGPGVHKVLFVPCKSLFP